MAIGKEEKEAVLRVLDSGILSGFQGNWSESFYGGTEIRALESEWSKYFNVKHSISCNSATSGLWMALSAIGIKPDDECIVTCYSMTCSASIPLHFCAKPVFADIEKDYYCLDPQSIEERITEYTRAIIVVDLFGQPYDADSINAIAEKYSKKYGHKIYVIEDAAQAVGAKYKGKYAGTLGDIGVYSLNVHKPIQCGEGGIVVTNDDDLAFKLRLAMNHSEAVINDIFIDNDIDKFVYALSPIVGMNLRMSELSAAIAMEQLKKLEGIIKIHKEYARCFPIKVRHGCEHSFYRYAWNGDWKTHACDKWNLFNAKYEYISPIFTMPLFKSLGYDQNQCQVCQKVNRIISLAWLKKNV